MVGEEPITANDPSEDTSFLTCLQGRPYDGLRCGIGSFLSTRRELDVQGYESEDGMGMMRLG